MDKIPKQPQTGGSALFRVELGGEQVVARYDTGEGEPVIGGTRHQIVFCRIYIIAVHKIESASVGDAFP